MDFQKKKSAKNSAEISCSENLYAFRSMMTDVRFLVQTWVNFTQTNANELKTRETPSSQVTVDVINVSVLKVCLLEMLKDHLMNDQCYPPRGNEGFPARWVMLRRLVPQN